MNYLKLAEIYYIYLKLKAWYTYVFDIIKVKDTLWPQWWIIKASYSLPVTIKSQVKKIQNPKSKFQIPDKSQILYARKCSISDYSDICQLINSTKTNLTLTCNKKSEILVESFSETQMRIRVRNKRAERLRRYGYRVEQEYRMRTKRKKTSITFDQDGQIIKLKCGCREFNEGPRNISAPCSDILALYITIIKFINLPFEIGKKYQFKELEDIAPIDWI